MDWIFQKIPLFVIFMIVYSIVKAVNKARQQRAEHTATHDETAEQRRVREIQERIRRIAAERQGGRVPADLPPVVRVPERQPGSLLRPPTPQLEPFGGPMKRTFGEIERLQPAPVAPPPVTVVGKSAELERQERFAEEMRVLEEAKMLAARRAAHRVADQNQVHQSESGQRAVARDRLLADLSNPESLRRAFVLREVLGTPVGLR